MNVCESESASRNIMRREVCRISNLSFVDFLLKMSDVFVKLMSQRGKSSRSTSSGGRPMHDQWCGFKKVDNNGRIAAQCIKCSKIVMNTAKTRLLSHREKCNYDGFEENKNIIDEVLQPPQRPPELNSDEHLLNLLCEIDQYNYEYLFERCKECNVNARQLKYFEKDHVRELIPKTNLGVLAEFEFLLEDWKVRNGPNDTSTAYYTHEFDTPKPKPRSSGDGVGVGGSIGRCVRQNRARPMSRSDEVTSPGQVLPDSEKDLEQQLKDVRSNASAYERRSDSLATSSTPTCSEEEEEDKEDEDKEQNGDAINRYNLTDIIPTELKKCQEVYKVNRKLLHEVDRHRMSTAIIEYFSRRSLPLTSRIIEQLVDQIVQYFPTESKRSWFDRRDGKRCGGRLYTKPHKAKKRRKKMALHDFEEVTVESILSNLSSDKQKNKNEFTDGDEFMDEDVNQDYVMEGFQKWLKGNKFEDWEDVINMWTNSLSYRKRQLFAIDPKTDASLSQLLNDWPAYALRTGHQLINIDFNGMYPKSEAAFSQRWRVYMEKICTLMEAELKDGTSLELLQDFKRKDNTLSKDGREAVLIKLLHALIAPLNHPYSITEAQLSTIRTIEYIAELESFSDAKPRIFLLGSSILKMDKCFVAFRNIRYELPFVEALRTCFQIHTLFKLDFPLPSANFWSFIGTYFFNFPRKSDIQHPALEGILNYLETFHSV